VTLRGLKLDTATEVRFPDSKATAKLLKKGKAGVPNMQKPEQVGDTEAQLEITLPADVADGSVPLVVVTPSGAGEPYRLLVGRALVEKEPNNGYAQSQSLTLPAVVDGAVPSPQDVDVYRIEGKAGQKVLAEVLASRHGSPLDALLSLSDARGTLLAANDDAESTDPHIEFTLPRDGVYFLSILDAHDQGGPAHVYRLAVRLR
jgi:hypothetical protein